MSLRHADPVTIDHIIDLRKRVSLLEKQIENVSSWITPMRQKNEKLRSALKKIGDRADDDDSWLAKNIDIRNISREALKE